MKSMVFSFASQVEGLSHDFNHESNSLVTFGFSRQMGPSGYLLLWGGQNAGNHYTRQITILSCSDYNN